MAQSVVAVPDAVPGYEMDRRPASQGWLLVGAFPAEYTPLTFRTPQEEVLGVKLLKQSVYISTDLWLYYQIVFIKIVSNYTSSI